MEDETTTIAYEDVEGKPAYDKYLPGPVQVLVEWLLLIVSTLLGYFQNKDE